MSLVLAAISAHLKAAGGMRIQAVDSFIRIKSKTLGRGTVCILYVAPQIVVLRFPHRARMFEKGPGYYIDADPVLMMKIERDVVRFLGPVPRVEVPQKGL